MYVTSTSQLDAGYIVEGTGLTNGGVPIIKAIKVVVVIVHRPVMSGVIWRVVWNEEQGIPAWVPVHTLRES